MEAVCRGAPQGWRREPPEAWLTGSGRGCCASYWIYLDECKPEGRPFLRLDFVAALESPRRELRRLHSKLLRSDLDEGVALHIGYTSTNASRKAGRFCGWISLRLWRARGGNYGVYTANFSGAETAVNRFSSRAGAGASGATGAAHSYWRERRRTSAGCLPAI